MTTRAKPRDLLTDALTRGIIPCAAYAVGRGHEIYDKASLGYRSLFPAREALTEDTRFDMASLTKLLSTTMVALRLLQEGVLLLSDPLARFFTPEELVDAPEGRREATVFHLMTHTSGITPHIPLQKALSAQGIDYSKASDSEIIGTILRSKPFGEVGEQVHYSCMGYILLQRIIERVCGQSLDRLAQDYVFQPLGMTQTGYLPFGDNQNHPEANVAVTEFSSHHGYYISGHVHDENAHFLGGISGNAGVFSTLRDCVTFAQMLSLGGALPAATPGESGSRLLSPRIFQLATTDHTRGKAESRGLGFQLRPPLPALSAAGDLFSYGSYGHTGFTGTSLYVDAQTGLWAVLLTNAVHLGRDKTEFFHVRRCFHNAVIGEFT